MKTTELIKIGTNANGQPAVSGRELHAALEVDTPYTKWFHRMVEYGFEEGKDYELLVGQKCPTNNPKNPWTEITDHAVSVDMAKQIGMLQRTEKGKEIREYFIACEKKLYSPEYQLNVMSTRLKIAECKLEVFGCDAEKTYDFDEAAAHLARFQKPPFGQNHLKAYLVKKGVLCMAHHKNGKPMQTFLNKGWFTPCIFNWKHGKKWKHETRYLLNNKGLMAIIDMMVRERFLHLPAPKHECFSFMSELLLPELDGATHEEVGNVAA